MEDAGKQPLVEIERLIEQMVGSESLVALTELNRNLQQASWISMSIFRYDQERDVVTGLNAMGQVSDELGFALLQETREIPESVMGFGIEKERGEPE